MFNERRYSNSLTPDLLAEQAGNCNMNSVLEAMRKAPTQAKRCKLLQEALQELTDGHPAAKAVASGYTTALLCWLERGLGVQA
jgi:hypothetical protein